MQSVWHDVHAKLIIHLSESITESLPEDLVARAEESVTLQGAGDDLTITRPDVSVTNSESWKQGVAPAWSPEVDESLAARIATPVTVQIGEQKNRWIEVTDSGGNLVTVIEILSPANKTKAGRDTFESKMTEFWSRGVNTVEIDLIRGGLTARDVRPGNWPEDPFHIIVTRGESPETQQVYKCPLREALPVFLIPLRSHEPDLPFDLQPLIDRCYERGRYWLLDYETDPVPGLSDSDIDWARDVISESQDS